MACNVHGLHRETISYVISLEILTILSAYLIDLFSFSVVRSVDILESRRFA
jgi:hypothetical protein